MFSSSLFIFILGTVGIVLLTWQSSIPTKRYHGLYRFFSFECILLLAILNIPVWLVDPLAWNQILSWIFLVVSLFLAVQGFLLLRVIGKPRGDFENTTVLVETGAYRYIRHPLYASLLALGTGIFLKNVTTTTTVLALVNALALIPTARAEEKEMLVKFGVEYDDYMKKTRMFIPFVF
jgi:protein-S-isoprenylcysteine O-methyltransferase Ste14